MSLGKKTGRVACACKEWLPGAFCKGFSDPRTIRTTVSLFGTSLHANPLHVPRGCIVLEPLEVEHQHRGEGAEGAATAGGPGGLPAVGRVLGVVLAIEYLLGG